jgi:esterase/lipase
MVTGRTMGDVVLDPSPDSARPEGWLSRWQRPLRWSAFAVAVLMVVFYGFGSWFFSNLVYDRALDPDRGEPTLDVEVLGFDGTTVTLSAVDPPDELTTEGVWGLETAQGYGQVDAIVSASEELVTRHYVHLTGVEPAPGVFARLDSKAFPENPLTGLGLDYEDVNVESDLGSNPAWFVDGGNSTWVLCFHGNSLNKLDCLRLLDITAHAGYPTLVATYRNSPGAPPDPSGIMGYGRTEWPDVEAAVAYARDHGAESVVVAGYSMGGAVVTSYLLESEDTDMVAGVILDAPALDLGAAINRGAEDESLPIVGLPVPKSLVSVTKWVSELRWDVDFGAIDYMARLDELVEPILLFHGEGDSTVPVSISDQLSEERPDLVWDYIRGRGAEHVATWNVAPDVYEKRVLTFLEFASV